MDIRKLEAFCKVCELHSFSKAGEALFLTQPTISAHIQTLEHIFGTRLIDRMGRTVLPTPAGKVLLRHAKEVFSHFQAAKAEIDALSSEISGEMTLGCSTIPAQYVLPPLLSQFMTTHPHVKLTVSIAPSRAIVQQVQEGTLTGGIVGSDQYMSPDISYTPFIQDEIVIIIPAMTTPLGREIHSLIKKSSSKWPEISFATATQLPWIMRDERSTTKQIFDSALRETGYDPRALIPRLTVDNSQASLTYVSEGLGVAAASLLATQQADKEHALQVVRLARTRIVRQFFSIRNTKRMLFPATQKFFEFIHSQPNHDTHE